MSTRAIIKIECDQYYNKNNPNNGTIKTQYYHHYDGYLQGVGLELINILSKLSDTTIISHSNDFDFFLKENFNQFYTKEDPNIKHSDLEYIYKIKITGTKEGYKNDKLTLTAYERISFSDNNIENWKKHELMTIKCDIGSQSLHIKTINFND